MTIMSQPVTIANMARKKSVITARVKPPIRISMAGRQRPVTPNEESLAAVGWGNIRMLSEYIQEHHKDHTVSHKYIWQLIKGDKPWEPQKPLKLLIERITGAKLK